MVDKPPSETQTTPKGAMVPVPTRDAFLRDLGKVAPPVAREPDDGAQDDEEAS